jgi:hypothetical protein
LGAAERADDAATHHGHLSVVDLKSASRRASGIANEFGVHKDEALAPAHDDGTAAQRGLVVLKLGSVDLHSRLSARNICEGSAATMRRNV